MMFLHVAVNRGLLTPGLPEIPWLMSAMRQESEVEVQPIVRDWIVDW